jgi:phosphate transport system protein
METATDKLPAEESTRILDMTVRGCEAARAAAAALVDGLTAASPEPFSRVREREEELDTLDREINEAVTTAITHCGSGLEARELLACLKVVIEVERISDLLLGFANRARAIFDRLEAHDLKDLSTMAVLLHKMLTEALEAFSKRDAEAALGVLRIDAEMDRLRNLLFVRHIENPEKAPRQESFHVVFMTQELERAGDHAKNVAEEVVHLVTGRSVRHLLRSQDKPDEVRFLDFMRRRQGGR